MAQSSTISGGLGRSQATRSSDSVRSIEDELYALGYDGIEFVARGRGQVAARSYSADGYRAEAIGRNEVAAAQSLVRVITRRQVHYRVEPRPEQPGVLITLDVEAADLVSAALDIVNPDEQSHEDAARHLALLIQHEADKERA